MGKYAKKTKKEKVNGRQNEHHVDQASSSDSEDSEVLSASSEDTRQLAAQQTLANNFTRNNPLPEPANASEEKAEASTEHDEKKEKISESELQALIHGAAVAAFNTYRWQATKSKNVPSIMKEGLDPSYGGTGASKGNKQFEETSKNFIHYTHKFHHADEYRRRAEGEEYNGFDAHPEYAEILELALPRNIREQESKDPDDRFAQKTSARIPSEHIRSTEPTPISPQDAGHDPIALTPGMNDESWTAHVNAGNAEASALYSNMDSVTTSLIETLRERGFDPVTLMAMLKQAIKSMSLKDVMDIVESMKFNRTALFGDESLSIAGRPVKGGASPHLQQGDSSHVLLARSRQTRQQDVARLRVLEAEARRMAPPDEKGKEEAPPELIDIWDEIEEIKRRLQDN